MEYAEQKGHFGAFSARNLVKNLVKSNDEMSFTLAEGLSPNRFWIPGRGQNG
jgi:hypothetical protein